MSGATGAQGTRVVAIGGGHGLAATLAALRSRPGTGALTAVVSVADDGGSSGRLRRQLAMPAPGDLRRCLVALAEPGTPWADAFEYRFPGEAGADLEGHPLGNLVIAALAAVTGDFTGGIGLVAGLLGVSGRVLPATAEPVDLVGEVDGSPVRGQVAIAEAHGRVAGLHVVPAHPGGSVRAPREVVEAIVEADHVVIGPGSLYTSVLAACVVPDIADALRSRDGGRTYVCNLRPELPETAELSTDDHLRVLADHAIPVDTIVLDPRWCPGSGVSGHPEVRGEVRAELTDDPATGHDPRRLGDALIRARIQGHRPPDPG